MNKLNPALAAYAHQLRTRICGICIHQEKLLLVRHQSTLNNKSFWAPPGGGLAYGEKIKDCLLREFKEETGITIHINRFLFLNEFLAPPLHALEYFFEVSMAAGEILTGTDPELGEGKQIIESVEFLTLAEINKIPFADKHRILHHLFSLDDLLGFKNHFLD
jgi:8-oxo-dGTP diphosphatase